MVAGEFASDRLGAELPTRFTSFYLTQCAGESYGTSASAGALGTLSLPARSTAVTVYQYRRPVDTAESRKDG